MVVIEDEEPELASGVVVVGLLVPATSLNTFASRESDVGFAETESNNRVISLKLV